MKIIQSFWSGGINDFSDNNFGWKSPYYHLLSWVLSANQLIKYYKNVELYTDKLGYSILIEKLKLPYNKVHVVLDELNDYESSLWALAKIRTYQLQTKPFIHVDGDVFIWKKFPKHFKNSSLITQNLETITHYYNDMWKNIHSHLYYLPSELAQIKGNLPKYSCNMGIAGGTDLIFFKKYCDRAFKFINKNRSSWKNINGFNFNIFFEQVLFYQLSNIDKTNVSFLFRETPKDNDYKGFGDFHNVPYQRTYLHLLGNYKINPYCTRAMRDYVIKEYPEFYKRILDVLNIKNTEIDFEYGFTKKENLVIINSFNNSVINKTIENIDNKYLFSRNLVFVDLPNYFDYILANKESIILERLPCNSIGAENDLKFLMINDLGGDKINIPVDELDEILLDEIDKVSNYGKLFKALENYLEEDVKENKKELKVFNQLVADRIRFFITRKIVFCYKKKD